MPESRLIKSGRHLTFGCGVLIVLTSLVSSFALANPIKQDDAERKHAFQLYKDGNWTEALPAFEKLASTNPNDPEVIERLGFLIIGQAVYLKDPAQRKQARLRGRELLARAEKMGANDVLLTSMLADIPADGGGDISFSSRKEVDDAMREGEAAFAKNDYNKAIESYQRALLLDPAQYTASLFAGDAYWQLGQSERAGEWYAKAIAINPDRETAYRYWGDVLMKQDKVSEARDKFIEAFIAEPYNRLARNALVQWGQQNHLTLAHPRIDIPTTVSPLADGKMSINLDASTLKRDDKDGSGAAWMMYGLVRSSWATSDFAKTYPQEKTYRHSLKEEAAALRAVLRVLRDEKKDRDVKKLDPSLQALIKLEKAGLLESYILLAIPDEGISRDFADYRRGNTDKLRRYVVDYILTGGGN